MSYINKFFKKSKKYAGVLGFLSVLPLSLSAQPMGTISGTVIDLQGAGIENVQVKIHDARCGGTELGFITTDSNGVYQIDNLPVGDVFVQTWAGGASDYYVSYSYDGGAGTLNCNNKSPIAIKSGEISGGIDFILPTGGAARGTIYDENGAPLENARVTFYGKMCNGDWLGSNRTDENGEYHVRGILSGEVYVRASAEDLDKPYIDEHYNGASGAFDCTKASSLTMNQEQTLTEVDAQLELGGFISGSVKTANGEAVSGGVVQIALETCGSTISNHRISSDGSYSTAGLPAGIVYMRTATSSADNSNSDYFTDEHFNGGVGTTNCNDATPVTVVGDQNTIGVDFELALGAAANGMVTDITGNPIGGVTVTARDKGCNGSWLASRRTSSDGTYTIRGIPLQNKVFFTVDEDDAPDGMAQSFWNKKVGSYFCNEAKGQKIKVQQTVDGVNFALFALQPAEFVKQLLTEVKSLLRIAKRKGVSKKVKAAQKSVKQRTRLVKSTVKENESDVTATLTGATPQKANKANKAAKKKAWGLLKKLVNQLLRA